MLAICEWLRSTLAIVTASVSFDWRVLVRLGMVNIFCSWRACFFFRFGLYPLQKKKIVLYNWAALSEAACTQPAGGSSEYQQAKLLCFFCSTIASVTTTQPSLPHSFPNLPSLCASPNTYPYAARPYA